MSLKGYEWVVDGKVVMTFTFKRLELYVWECVDEKELQDFINWLAKRNYKPSQIIHCEKK